MVFSQILLISKSKQLKSSFIRLGLSIFIAWNL